MESPLTIIDKLKHIGHVVSQHCIIHSTCANLQVGKVGLPPLKVNCTHLEINQRLMSDML
jgi:hypothetical protein